VILAPSKKWGLVYLLNLMACSVCGSRIRVGCARRRALDILIVLGDPKNVLLAASVVQPATIQANCVSWIRRSNTNLYVSVHRPVLTEKACANRTILLGGIVRPLLVLTPCMIIKET